MQCNVPHTNELTLNLKAYDAAMLCVRAGCVSLCLRAPLYVSLCLPPNHLSTCCVIHSFTGSGRTLHGALIPETLMLTSLVACPENTPWTSSIYTCPKHKTKKKVYERFPFAIIGTGGWVHPRQASIWKWPRVVNPTKWGFNGIGQMSLLRVTFQPT